MIAPVFAAGALGLVVGVLLSKDREGALGWLAGAVVLVLTIGMSRLLAEYGFFAALSPEIIGGLAVAFLTWRKSSSSDS